MPRRWDGSNRSIWAVAGPGGLSLPAQGRALLGQREDFLLAQPLAIDPEVLKRLGTLSKGERAECLQALCDLCETFGRPPVHSGVSIRKLGRSLFECRGNPDLRFVFQDRPDCLYVRCLGNHDEIQSLLRSGKG